MKILLTLLSSGAFFGTMAASVAASAADPVVNSIGMRLTAIPSGTFEMGEAYGNDDVDRDEMPPQTVTMRPYFLGSYEITNAEWTRVMGEPPPHNGQPNQPVVGVSWHDAVEFCERLSTFPKEIAVGRVYRLPSEAEWEYACRAGSQTAFCFGDKFQSLGEHAWHTDPGSGQNPRGPQPVGKKQANEWGLYDMHGNVWEWCSSAYTRPYGGPAQRNAAGDDLRVIRGGSWQDDAWYCRSAYRCGASSTGQVRDRGFRVAMTASHTSNP